MATQMNETLNTKSVNIYNDKKKNGIEIFMELKSKANRSATVFKDRTGFLRRKSTQELNLAISLPSI